MIRSFLALAMIATLASPSLAVKQFQIQFLKKYAEGSDEAFNEKVKDAKCWVCHQGRKKTNNNVYGNALSELLDRKKDMRDDEKIVAALEKVAKMHSDPKDKESPTFGELIAAGKLPGGTLEESKEEPKKEK